MNRWAIGIIMMVLVIAGVIYGIYEKNDYDFKDSTKSYKIINKWELPSELEEVSGIHWVSDDRIACIQDEEGIIFIFDLNSNSIVKRYKFGPAGDYEALTFLNGEYWVIESSGKLYNIKNLDLAEKDAGEITLEFEYRHNIEGLASTQEGELWLAVKERNLDNRGDYKAIYSFDPKTNKLNYDPVVKINYNDPAFDVLRTSNPRKLIRPSDISFNPVTGELYVLDAEFQKLLILKESGKIKELHLLDPEEFSQPEGLCFSPSGRMFIANEGLGGAPNIIELKFFN